MVVGPKCGLRLVGEIVVEARRSERAVEGCSEPVWGLRLPPHDFTHNDLNFANVIGDDQRITGVVDCDEFGLGCRAIDLVLLAFDCDSDHQMIGPIGVVLHSRENISRGAGEDPMCSGRHPLYRKRRSASLALPRSVRSGSDNPAASRRRRANNWRTLKSLTREEDISLYVIL